MEIERLSPELFMSDFRYQDSTKWWCYQWLGLNLSKPRSFLEIIPKTSKTKFRQIRISKSKVIHIQIPVSKLEKTKKWGKKFGLHNEAIRGLHIGIGFRGYQEDFIWQEIWQTSIHLFKVGWNEHLVNDFPLVHR